MWKPETAYTRNELAILMRMTANTIVCMVRSTAVGTMMDLSTLMGAEQLFEEYGKEYGKLYEESQ